MKVVKTINDKKYPNLAKLVATSKSQLVETDNGRYTIGVPEGKKINSLTKINFVEMEALEKHCKMNFTYFWAFSQ